MLYAYAPPTPPKKACQLGVGRVVGGRFNLPTSRPELGPGHGALQPPGYFGLRFRIQRVYRYVTHLVVWLYLSRFASGALLHTGFVGSLLFIWPRAGHVRRCSKLCQLFVHFAGVRFSSRGSCFHIFTGPVEAGRDLRWLALLEYHGASSS